MANNTVKNSPTIRGTVRETIITPVDEKYFESELRRVDSTIANVARSQEKFEKEVFKRFDKMDSDIKNLRSEVNMRFSEMNARFNEMNDRLWWIMGVMIVSILIPIITKYF